MRILQVEDDAGTAQSIELMLRSEGMNVYTTDLGAEAIDLARLYDYDLITLDLNLPDMSGYEVLRTLRKNKIKTPVIIVSGLCGLEDKVRGLALGADDYVTKPFHKDELAARILAVHRRAKGHAENKVHIGKLCVDLDVRKVSYDGTPIALTVKEFAMVELLATRRGTTLTKEMFLNHMYGGMDEPELKIVDVFVSYVRKKLRAASGGIDFIETIWGRGYTMSSAADSSTFVPDISVEKNQDTSLVPDDDAEAASVFPLGDDRQNAAQPVRIYVWGNTRLSLDSQQLSVDGRDVRLNGGEWYVLYKTVSNPLVQIGIKACLAEFARTVAGASFEERYFKRVVKGLADKLDKEKSDLRIFAGFDTFALTPRDLGVFAGLSEIFTANSAKQAVEKYTFAQLQERSRALVLATDKMIQPGAVKDGVSYGNAVFLPKDEMLYIRAEGGMARGVKLEGLRAHILRCLVKDFGTPVETARIKEALPKTRNGAATSDTYFYIAIGKLRSVLEEAGADVHLQKCGKRGYALMPRGVEYAPTAASAPIYNLRELALPEGLETAAAPQTVEVEGIACGNLAFVPSTGTFFIRGEGGVSGDGVKLGASYAMLLAVLLENAGRFFQADALAEALSLRDPSTAVVEDRIVGLAARLQAKLVASGADMHVCHVTGRGFALLPMQRTDMEKANLPVRYNIRDLVLPENVNVPAATGEETLEVLRFGNTMFIPAQDKLVFGQGDDAQETALSKREALVLGALCSSFAHYGSVSEWCKKYPVLQRSGDGTSHIFLSRPEQYLLRIVESLREKLKACGSDLQIFQRGKGAFALAPAHSSLWEKFGTKIETQTVRQPNGGSDDAGMADESAADKQADDVVAATGISGEFKRRSVHIVVDDVKIKVRVGKQDVALPTGTALAAFLLAQGERDMQRVRAVVLDEMQRRNPVGYRASDNTALKHVSDARIFLARHKLV